MKRNERFITRLFVLTTLVVVSAPGCAARRAVRSTDAADATRQNRRVAWRGAQDGPGYYGDDGDTEDESTGAVPGWVHRRSWVD